MSGVDVNGREKGLFLLMFSAFFKRQWKSAEVLGSVKWWAV